MLRVPRLLGLFGGLLLAGAAQAVMVDLTAGGWSGFDNQTSATRTFGGHRVTLSTGGADRLTFSAYDGEGGSAACGRLACAGDGVGINDDEISHGRERLTASFSNAVTLNSVQFLDLFGAGRPGDPVAEGAGMLIEFADGGSEFLTAFGTDLGDAGYLDFAIGLIDVMSISFFTNTDLPASSDFALAGLDLDWAEDDIQIGPETNDPSLNDSRGPASLLQQSVPAPGLPWLMLIGLILIGLTGARARCLPGSDRTS